MTKDVVVEQVFQARCRTCGAKAITLSSEVDLDDGGDELNKWADDHVCAEPSSLWRELRWYGTVLVAAFLLAAVIVGALYLTGIGAP